MINFIIYENDKKYRQLYVSLVLKSVGNTKYAYKIIEIEKYDKNTMKKLNKLTGKKVFILDVDVPGKSGLDLIKEVRDSGDWESQMIVVTNQEHLRNIAYTSKNLILDFISKYYNCEENLRESLVLAMNILDKYKSLNYQYNGELFQIPYHEILYIEKNMNNQYSTVITKQKKVEINKTIGMIEKELDGDDSFVRTHRSCIVNVDNIRSIRLKEGIINFDKHTITLLSRENKTKLKERYDTKR